MNISRGPHLKTARCRLCIVSSEQSGTRSGMLVCRDGPDPRRISPGGFLPDRGAGAAFARLAGNLRIESLPSSRLRPP